MRLIDADELKTAFPCGESVRTECVRATIDYAPTIDPAKHVQWKLVTDNRGQHFECPYCGEWKYHQHQHYCGNCGCKMDEVGAWMI